MQLGIRLLSALLLASALQACAHWGPMDAEEAGPSTTIWADEAALETADRVLVLIPGALNSLSIFGDDARWRDAGYALIKTPMPGMDGAPLDPPLKLRRAARALAERVSEGPPDRPVRIIGFSAGASVALETASLLGRRGRDVRVAVVSGLPGFPGAFQAGWSAAVDSVGLMISLRSTDFGEVWDVYYTDLLFGSGAWRDPALAAKAKALRAESETEIVPPSVALLSAQVGDIAFWSGSVSGDMSRVSAAFFHGRDDPVIPLRSAERLARLAPQGRLSVRDDLGHMLLHADPAIFDDILAFFAEPSSAPAAPVR